MNNTTTTTRTTRTKRNLALAAFFVAVTLVVGTLATTTNTIATTGQSAYAYSQKEDNGKGNDNGNTVTIEECKNRGSASGFDTALDQECENLICTHPGENATCVQEGAVATTTTTTTPTPVKLTCEQCFTKFLSSTQRTILLGAAGNLPTLGELCARLPTLTSEVGLRSFLISPTIGLSESAAAQLIQCLKDAGIVFPTVRG
jgi:hypothetical protein